jgi:hypothetical protein
VNKQEKRASTKKHPRIDTAVRCTFRWEHPAPIYLLASSAREILTTIGSKMGVKTVLHGLAEDTGKKLGRIVEEPRFVCAACGRRGSDVRPDFATGKKPAYLG